MDKNVMSQLDAELEHAGEETALSALASLSSTFGLQLADSPYSMASRSCMVCASTSALKRKVSISTNTERHVTIN